MPWEQWGTSRHEGHADALVTGWNCRWQSYLCKGRKDEAATSMGRVTIWRGLGQDLRIGRKEAA